MHEREKTQGSEKSLDEALRQNIIEGCREMWDVNVETEREFHPLEEEVAHANPPG